MKNFNHDVGRYGNNPKESDNWVLVKCGGFRDEATKRRNKTKKKKRLKKHPR